MTLGCTLRCTVASYKLYGSDHRIASQESVRYDEREKERTIASGVSAPSTSLPPCRRARANMMLLRSAARRAAALAAGRHHATLRSQQAACGAKRPAAKASTRSPILKPPLRTAERRTVKAAGSSAARHTPSSARMRPKPQSVGTAIGVGSRVVDSAGTCGEIVARNVAWLTMRSDAGAST